MKSLHPSRMLLTLFVIIGYASVPSFSQKSITTDLNAWTDSFDMGQCEFSSAGENAYFILKPSYQLSFEGVEGNDTTRLVITVTNETEKVGNVETRVVEERESVNGQVIEISRNFFAFCTQTNTLFYFGEEVDMYKRGVVVGHGGSWRADSGGAKPGVMMPGIVLLGARYYQEMAPGVAMDRAAIVSISETVETPADRFANCLKTEETTPLEPKAREYKFYAPRVGLVKDGGLLLTRHGFK